ncbi:hypothetical protein ACGF5T_34605 [Streptomyces sp. NPDC047853]|uniref:hypothetical protein n=1 Tax=unclassified Streptomyces TaxID=2593676 RepID=UPI00345391B2
MATIMSAGSLTTITDGIEPQGASAVSRTRRTWNTTGRWTAGIALAAVFALTGCTSSSGDDSDTEQAGKGGASTSASVSASPKPGYTPPDDWSEPERWTALPAGERMDMRGSEVGFPHTVEGAVAMAAVANTTAIDGSRSSVDEQLRIYHSYVTHADQSDEHADQIERTAIETDELLRQEMGVKAGAPLPSGAYMRSTVIGYKFVHQSMNEIAVWLLFRTALKAGEMEKESISYGRILNAVVWEGGDWKLSGAATQRALESTQKGEQPKIVAPGDSDFNASGWTAIREAS